MTNLVSISNSTLALLGKMRDEIGSLHRDKRKLQQNYDVLVKRTAELQSVLHYLELFHSDEAFRAAIEDIDPTWGEYPHLITPKV